MDTDGALSPGLTSRLPTAPRLVSGARENPATVWCVRPRHRNQVVAHNRQPRPLYTYKRGRRSRREEMRRHYNIQRTGIGVVQRWHLWRYRHFSSSAPAKHEHISIPQHRLHGITERAEAGRGPGASLMARALNSVVALQNKGDLSTLGGRSPAGEITRE